MDHTRANEKLKRLNLAKIEILTINPYIVKQN